MPGNMRETSEITASTPGAVPIYDRTRGGGLYISGYRMPNAAELAGASLTRQVEALPQHIRDAMTSGQLQPQYSMVTTGGGRNDDRQSPNGVTGFTSNAPDGGYYTHDLQGNNIGYTAPNSGGGGFFNQITRGVGDFISDPSKATTNFFENPGVKEAAIIAAIAYGVDPTLLSGAGTAGATAAFTPEMIAAGMTPGSIGAAGAASGALTGANLAAASGLGSLGAEAILPSINEMVASGMSPGSAGAAGAAAGALTPAELAAAAGTTAVGTTAAGLSLSDIVKNAGSIDGLLNLTALSALMGGNKPNSAGYNIPVPELSMTRQQVMPNDPNRRPGSGGLNYFTDPKYVKLGDTAAQAAADSADTQQAAGIKAAYTPAVAKVNPYIKTGTATNLAALNNAATNPVTSSTPAIAENELRVPEAQLTGGLHMAQGGLAAFAKGGNNYLQGSTDGMADKLDTTIDDKQAAKLSHGEFVIPADVVSHLGNGNSEAGAHKLYDMMARIRKARTGNPEQGKRINPDKFMPGGSVGYSGGGAIAFNTGGTTPASTSSSDVLSDWAGPLVSGALAKGFAASNAPYQAYTGDLTAGESNLQQQAFAGASDIAKTGYTPTNFTTGTFDTSAANKYMNPYLSASLNPQLQELQRQSQISNTTNAGKLTQAGAFGGSRQAILQGEENRNLLDKSQDLIGTGYNTAYNNAMNQFNTEQGRGMDAQKASEASRTYSADYGLKSVQNLADLGATQRGITSEGIAADKKQFEEQRDNPLAMAQYQRSLLKDLPITTTNKNVNQSPYSQLMGSSSDLLQLKDALKALGIG